MKQKLAVMDEQMRTLKLTLNKLSATSSSGKTGNNDEPDVEYLPARRTRREVTVTLQSLERRLKVLEARYVTSSPQERNNNCSIIGLNKNQKSVG